MNQLVAIASLRMCPRALFWSCAFCLCSSLAAQSAAAQDMAFTLEETGRPPAALVDAPPSEALANGLRLYQRGRFQEAAVQFSRIVSGSTEDSVANVAKAQFFLSKSLFHLGHHRAALSIFEEITERGSDHPYFVQSLPWLAQLATQLPEPAGVVELVGRYPAETLATLDATETSMVHQHLRYLSARYAYAHGALERASRLFDAVDPDSEHYAAARFFAGVTHVRRRRARPAIDAFRSVLEVADRGREHDAHLRNLAWLSLARVYYTAAHRRDETGAHTVDPALLEAAIDAWDRVEPSSEHWLEALFEQAWGLYLSHQESRAMGNLFTLASPYFEGAYYPEALILEAVVFFGACQTENAEAKVREFHERYDPVREELATVMAGFADHEALYRFLLAVRSGEAALSPRIRGVVSSTLSDRTLLRHLEYIRLLDLEAELLEARPAVFRDSPLGDRIRADLTVTRSFAIDGAGELVEARFERLVLDLDELMNQMDTVELEIYRVRREGLTEAQRAERERIRAAGGLEIEVDEEHQVWPFDGEYWRDELPYYRQRVSSICTR